MFKTYLQFTLRLCVLVFSLTVFSQTAPNVGYGVVPNYFINTTINSINSNNNGGTINSGTFRNVTTFAGTGTSGSADNANPLLASFNSPKGMVKDKLGNYYVAEDLGKKIRKVAVNGAVSLVASVGSNVYDITINSDNGDLYYTTNHVICKLANTNAANYPAQNPTYVNAVTIVAGSSSGFTNATGTSAKFNTPVGIAMAPDNSYLLIADQANHRIRKMTLPEYVVTTFAGTGTTGGSDAAVSAATLNNPMDVIFASASLVYVGEGVNGNRVRKIENDAITTLAGNSSGTFTSTTGFNDGAGAEAFMKYAFGLTIDNVGNVYVAETSNFKIRKITPSGVVSTIAGTLDTSSGSTDAIGNNASFLYPEGVYFDKEGGFLLVCDKGNHKIRKIDLSGFAIAPPLTAGLTIDSGTGTISGTPTAYSLATQYQNNFNLAQAGTTATGGIPSTTGDAVFKGEMLLLTPKLNSKSGGFEIPATGINSNLLKVNFKVITEKTSGGADGLSYSFAPDASGTALTPSAELGTGSKISISFTDYASNNRGIRLYYNPSTVSTYSTSINTTLLAYSNNTSWIGKTAVVAINIDDLGKLTLTLDGVVLFNNIQLPADYLNADKSTWKHVFKSKTGGSNDTHALDDISIQQGYGKTNYTVTASNGYGDSVTNVAILVAEPLTVSTTAISQVTGASAVSGGVINPTSLALVTETGMVWSTLTNPTITANAGMTTEEIGTTFSSSITGLLGLTTYYARAYATSASGTVYGNEISFTTLISPPNIDYASLTNTYLKGTAITPLNPTNTGGDLGGAGPVSTFADGIIYNIPIQRAKHLAFDALGNLFVVDGSKHNIKKITPAGVVTIFAGSVTGTLGYANGVGTNALFYSPDGIAVTSAGIIYVADTYNFKIRKITPDGTVSDFVGSGGEGLSDGTGTAASFTRIRGIALDAFENLLVADYNSVRKVTPAGEVTTIAGAFVSGSADGQGIQARFSDLNGIVVAPSGTIYVTDTYNNRIRAISPTGEVTTLAGSTLGFSDGTGTAAKFSYPTGISIDASGFLYVADSNNNKIRKISASGIVTTLAGSQQGFSDGDASVAKFALPHGIAVAQSGSIYVADSNNSVIRRIEIFGYSISPTLPAGLSLNADTGVISGTPTVASPATNYVLTGSNAGGSSVKTMSITVLLMNLPAISYPTPNVFNKHTAITPLNPTNTGGYLGGPTVTTFADGSSNGIELSGARHLAFDALGNLFVADGSAHNIKKITPAGVVTIFAGSVTGTAGSVNGVGTNARFSSPDGIAVTSAGIIYVTDANNYKIRKITPDGTVSDFVGSGAYDFFDGTGTAASFKIIKGIALDASGNLFVADRAIVRKVTPAGEVTTFAGDSSAYGSADGQGIQAKFANLTGIVVAPSGTIYVVDSGNYRIRAISPTGEVTTVAGSRSGFSDGTGTAAKFGYSIGISSDASGFLYVVDSGNHKIRKISASGIVTTLAGNGSSGFLDGDASVAQFAQPHGIAVAQSGSIYVAEPYNGKIRRIELSGYSISPTLPAGLSLNPDTGVISGTPTEPSPATDYVVTGTNAGGSNSFTTNIAVLLMNLPAISYPTPNVFNKHTAITPINPTNTGGDVGGPATVTTFTDGSSNGIGLTRHLAFDALGNLFVVDGSSHNIKKITPAGVVTIFAGSVTGTAGSVNGVGTNARFSSPDGIAVTSAGIIYVADANNYKIRKITPDGTVSDFVGSGVNGLSDGTGTAASFSFNRGIALDASENLLVADLYRVRKVTPAGEVTTFAGNTVRGTADGQGIQAQFHNLSGIVVAPSGTIYVVDSGNNRIRAISPTGAVSTLAGSTEGFSDGTGTAAQFSYPIGISSDASGFLYVVDANNSKIRKISASGIVTTLAGNEGGFVDGDASVAQFLYPHGIAVAQSGSIYVTDSFNRKIRRIELPGYSANPTLPAGLSLNPVTGVISGTPTAVSPATDYVVTGTNKAGSGMTTVSIAVEEGAPIELIPTWTGTQWINGTLSASNPAIIEGNYTPSVSFEVGALTIKNDAIVNVGSGINLTVNGKLTVEPGSTLTLDSNANLLQTTDVTNSGLISINRNTAPLKLLDYVLWSSPVSDQQLQSFSSATLSNRFYTYNSGTNLYNAVANPSMTLFADGKGYLIRMPNDHPTTPTIWTGSFTGIPNNGTVNLSVTSGTYNAIGNPYASTIDTNAFIDANGITEALYFWRKTNNSANPSYATYTKAGGIGTANSADPNGLIPNGVIQVGQGFIVKSASNAISFTNAMRSANNGNQFLRTKIADKSRIWLNLTNASGFFSQAMVAYMDGATSGIDAAIDGRYFNDCQTALTSIISNEEFSIQGRSLPFDASDVVPLGFKTETIGEFALAIDHTDGLFAAGQKVFLKDNLTNTVHDLSAEPYNFKSEAGVFNSRFALVYQKTLGTNDADVLSNQVMVYKQNDKIRIDAGSIIMAGVNVYDLNGRLLFERKKINANQTILSIVAPQAALLIKITSNDGTVITKKLIN